MSSLRIALCQMLVSRSKEDNIRRAAGFVAEAASKGAELVVLPECFNCPYGTKYFAEYSEVIPKSAAEATASGASPTVAAMAAAAAEHRVWLVAGSIPEVEPARAGHADAKPRLYNSSIFFSPTGDIVNVHRKVHLFKIDTPTVKFDESEVLTAGASANAVRCALPAGHTQASATEPGTDIGVGVGICFDVRYPQLATHYSEQGTGLLVYPGAFNLVTGPPHWLLTARARAIDNQQFVALCSPARDTTAEYVAYGHSAVVDPWGETVAQAGEGEELVLATLDLSLIASTRRRLPITAGIRNDVYRLNWTALPQL